MPSTAARVPPPLRVEAELVERRITSGRNQPLLLHVRDDSGAPHQCVSKMRGPHLQPDAYLAEWLGAALARAVGINSPDSFAVTISSELADASGAEFQAELRASVGVVYGSRFMTGYTQYARDYPLNPSLRDTAACIVAFDVFVHNVDRRADNSNLFIERSGFLAFDHELAFAFVHGLIGAPDPVEDHCPSIVAQHALRAALRRKKPSIAAFRAALAGLDTGFFADLAAASPPEWTADHARGKLDKIVEVLQKRRDAADRWLPKVLACLDQ